jgi:hypothetical protein
VRGLSTAFANFMSEVNPETMISTTDIRNKVIDQLLAIKDDAFLRALSELIDKSHVQHEAVPLSEEQKAMLAMSEEDIQAGRTVDQLTLNERELEWLKRK